MDVTEILTHAPPPSVSYPALNPHTPLSYVSAGTATQMSIGSYVVVGSLAVRLRFALRSEMNPHQDRYPGLLWDILQNLPADLKILTQSRIRLQSIVYLVSRLLSLAHVLWSAVFYVSAVGNCADNLLGLSVLYPLSISASTLLLLCRMRLVYDDNLRVVGPFSVLWFFTLAAAMAPIVYDTAVYIAVAYRLTAAPCGKVSMREWRVFSKLIFEDSRLYYVVALSSNTLTAIMILANSISIPLRSAFFVLNVTLVNIMACQAHRQHEAPNVPTSQLHYL
ncbi:hypothetical protein FA13DRAFT_1806958 [Coprinellus micaceus]|uniref:Uncharacterized protein n=1 Tax=Coprinellus micaceus TaxID=71717 RepID=A0A4Y7RJ64_COPMI|nr:hypothetical protein FA13DRAFT_1806958 [Coprinellus micaceus]